MLFVLSKQESSAHIKFNQTTLLKKEMKITQTPWILAHSSKRNAASHIELILLGFMDVYGKHIVHSKIRTSHNAILVIIIFL